MIGYIARRIGTAIILAVLVTFITFLLLSTSFENVTRKILGSGATEETVAAMMQRQGFDRPVLVQYFDWLTSAFSGDFGRSIFTSLEVVPVVLQRFGVTLSLIIPALIICALISVLLGIWAASRGGVVDRIAQALSLLGYVIPGLLLAIVLVFVFAVRLKWLPATGYVSPFEDPAGWIRSVTLPVVVLVIAGVANMTAQVRGTMIGELRKDYVRTLRTRGVPTPSLVLKHAFRNAASPAFTVFSLEFLNMFGAALIIENIFGLPGIGFFAFNASMQGDIPVILGLTVFTVLLVTTVNLSTDVVNAWLNPKVKL